MMKQSCTWSPVALTQRWGPLYEAMKGGRAWWWRWATVAVLTIVAGVTGAGGVRGGGCTASLAVCCAILCVTGVFLTLARPYALPSENVLNPIKFLLLGVTCLVLLISNDSTDALTALGVCTAVLTLLRLLAKTYCRLTLSWTSSRLANQDDCFENDSSELSFTLGAPLRTRNSQETTSSSSSGSNSDKRKSYGSVLEGGPRPPSSSSDGSLMERRRADSPPPSPVVAPCEIPIVIPIAAPPRPTRSAIPLSATHGEPSSRNSAGWWLLRGGRTSNGTALDEDDDEEDPYVVRPTTARPPHSGGDGGGYQSILSLLAITDEELQAVGR